MHCLAASLVLPLVASALYMEVGGVCRWQRETFLLFLAFSVRYFIIHFLYSSSLAPTVPPFHIFYLSFLFITVFPLYYVIISLITPFLLTETEFVHYYRIDEQGNKCFEEFEV